MCLVLRQKIKTNGMTSHISYTYYEKEMNAQFVILEPSAMAQQQKEQTLSQEIVRRLTRVDKTREQAEKIVGSFVKHSSDQGKEGVSDAETDQTQHGMYNQDVDENSSSGRKIKEDFTGTGHPQPKITEEDEKVEKDQATQGRGMGVRGLGAYNTAQQGNEILNQVSPLSIDLYNDVPGPPPI